MYNPWRLKVNSIPCPLFQNSTSLSLSQWVPSCMLLQADFTHIFVIQISKKILSHHCNLSHQTKFSEREPQDSLQKNLEKFNCEWRMSTKGFEMEPTVIASFPSCFGYHCFIFFKAQVTLRKCLLGFFCLSSWLKCKLQESKDFVSLINGIPSKPRTVSDTWYIVNKCYLVGGWWMDGWMEMSLSVSISWPNCVTLPK